MSSARQKLIESLASELDSFAFRHLSSAHRASILLNKIIEAGDHESVTRSFSLPKIVGYDYWEESDDDRSFTYVTDAAITVTVHDGFDTDHSLFLERLSRRTWPYPTAVSYTNSDSKLSGDV